MSTESEFYKPFPNQNKRLTEAIAFEDVRVNRETVRKRSVQVSFLNKQFSREERVLVNANKCPSEFIISQHCSPGFWTVECLNEIWEPEEKPKHRTLVECPLPQVELTSSFTSDIHCFEKTSELSTLSKMPSANDENSCRVMQLHGLLAFEPSLQVCRLSKSLSNLADSSSNTSIKSRIPSDVFLTTKFYESVNAFELKTFDRRHFLSTRKSGLHSKTQSRIHMACPYSYPRHCLRRIKLTGPRGALVVYLISVGVCLFATVVYYFFNYEGSSNASTWY